MQSKAGPMGIEVTTEGSRARANGRSGPVASQWSEEVRTLVPWCRFNRRDEMRNFVPRRNGARERNSRRNTYHLVNDICSHHYRWNYWLVGEGSANARGR